MFPFIICLPANKYVLRNGPYHKPTKGALSYSVLLSLFNEDLPPQFKTFTDSREFNEIIVKPSDKFFNIAFKWLLQISDTVTAV